MTFYAWSSEKSDDSMTFASFDLLVASHIPHVPRFRLRRFILRVASRRCEVMAIYTTQAAKLHRLEFPESLANTALERWWGGIFTSISVASDRRMSCSSRVVFFWGGLHDENNCSRVFSQAILIQKNDYKRKLSLHRFAHASASQGMLSVLQALSGGQVDAIGTKLQVGVRGQ